MIDFELQVLAWVRPNKAMVLTTTGDYVFSSIAC